MSKAQPLPEETIRPLQMTGPKITAIFIVPPNVLGPTRCFPSFCLFVYKNMESLLYPLWIPLPQIPESGNTLERVLCVLCSSHCPALYRHTQPVLIVGDTRAQGQRGWSSADS